MTTPMSKAKFLAWAEKEIPDDACIVLSNNVVGDVKVSKKGLHLPMIVSQSAFKAEGVGHIAFGKSHPFSVVITDREQMSEDALKIIDKPTHIQS